MPMIARPAEIRTPAEDERDRRGQADLAEDLPLVESEGEAHVEIAAVDVADPRGRVEQYRPERDQEHEQEARLDGDPDPDDDQRDDHDEWRRIEEVHVRVEHLRDERVAAHEHAEHDPDRKADRHPDQHLLERRPECEPDLVVPGKTDKLGGDAGRR